MTENPKKSYWTQTGSTLATGNWSTPSDAFAAIAAGAEGARNIPLGEPAAALQRPLGGTPL